MSTRTLRLPRLARFRRALVLAVLLSAAALPAGPVVAQDNQVTALTQQIQHLRDDLTILQRNYYQGRQAPLPPPAALAPGGDPAFVGQQATAFEVRMNSLEDELRNLLGIIERIERGATDSRARLDKLVGDVDFRLNAIERNLAVQTTVVTPPAAPAPLPQAAAAAPRPATPPAAAALSPPRPQAPVDVAPGRPNPAAGAQVLGVLTPEQARAPAPLQPAPQAAAQPTPQPAGMLPLGTAKQQYDFAHGLLQQFRIPEAERAFTEFLGQHANDELSHNARYWLGETHYARAQYPQAAVTFFDGYQKAPTGPKAADNLLKLGMSLGRMDQKQEACAALTELNQRFPNATAAIRDQATQERRRLSCG